jgi:pSer/pThr/pTyr-binding forkhead associated (FHA) protein
MPITVVVRSTTSTEPPSLTFDGSRIVLGRSAGSDVRLPDPSVSLRHASIRVQGADYVLVDEGSTNGTWVGGVRLSPHAPRLLRSGDILRLGRVDLEIALGQRPATPELGLATRELALQLVRSAMAAAGDDTRPIVRVIEGPDLGRELRLEDDGSDHVLGRSERCALALADEDASREHVSIRRHKSQVLLRDLGSMNGCFLGDSRVPSDREVAWRPQVLLSLGRSVLALDEPVGLVLAQLETADDEKLDEPVAPPAQPAPAPEPNEAPPSSAPAKEPVAARPSLRPRGTRRAPRLRRAWTTADLAVVAFALLIIAASLGGLAWVLK